LNERQRQQAVLRDLLRQMRKDAGLRQSELAERLGKPQSFVSKVETGERRLDLIELRDYCAGCGIDLRSFIGLLEERI
jgi:transcriptional regulator with XRE-family HTH domain